MKYLALLFIVSGAYAGNDQSHGVWAGANGQGRGCVIDSNSIGRQCGTGYLAEQAAERARQEELRTQFRMNEFDILLDEFSRTPTPSKDRVIAVARATIKDGFFGIVHKHFINATAIEKKGFFAMLMYMMNNGDQNAIHYLTTQYQLSQQHFDHLRLIAEKLGTDQPIDASMMRMAVGPASYINFDLLYLPFTR